MRIVVDVFSPGALKKQKSNWTTGDLLCCFGWLSLRPFDCTHVGHQDLNGKCVSSCSALSCGVGWSGVLRPFALAAGCCSSSCSSQYSSLYVCPTSKFVEPIHSWLSFAKVFVVQSSSIL